MTLFVNNIEFNLFEGAKIMDAARAYYRASGHALPPQFPVVLDNFGNTLEPDGELSPMQRIYLVDFQYLNNEYENF